MRLIDADTLMEAIDHRTFEIYGSIVWDDGDWWIRHKVLEQVVKEQPSVESEPVRHGHWINTPTSPLGFTCSECGKEMCRFNYCPHCGALMGEVT